MDLRQKPDFSQLVDEVLAGIDENTTDHTINLILTKYQSYENSEGHKIYESSEGDIADWIRELKSEIDGFGPLQKLLDDLEVTEICANSHDQIFYEKSGLLFRAENGFSSPVIYSRFIKNLLKLIDKTGDIRHPLVDGVFENARVHLSLPPISQTPVVTIRKHGHQNWGLNDLLLQGMFSQTFLGQLRGWISEKKNILVCGATGSGKTTFMRAVLKECSPSERIVSLEDTPELGSVGPHHVTMITRPDPEGLIPAVDLSLLLKNTLRMRPDRIVVGEVRGAEALTLLDALSTGHRGAICTLHAHSAQHALKRLESLVLRACSQWSMHAVRQIIVDSIDVVIICSKKNGLRVVSQTALLRGAEDFGYLLEEIT